MSYKKIEAKVKYYGYNFLLKPTINYDRNGKVQSVGINRVEAAKMVRQFIKFKYGKHPDFKVWARSESYSGGSSLRVYVSNLDGTAVSNDIFNTIKDFAMTLAAGSFDGMTDSYDYKQVESNVLGTKISMYTSYVFVDNEAPRGTKERKLELESREESFDSFKTL